MREDLQIIGRLARHCQDAEKGKNRNHSGRKSLEDPYRQQVHEMPSRIDILAGRIPQTRHSDEQDQNNVEVYVDGYRFD